MHKESGLVVEVQGMKLGNLVYEVRGIELIALPSCRDSGEGISKEWLRDIKFISCSGLTL